MDPRLTPELAQQALTAKKRARRNQTRLNLYLLAGVMLAVGLALTWLLLYPGSQTSAATLVLAAIAGGSIAGFVVHHRRSKNLEAAACPRCGQSWEIREGASVALADRMPDWDKCPGCGVPMREGLLARMAGDAASRDQPAGPLTSAGR